ncbi:DNA polymerase ligase N-terminal domain-containing protein [Nocardioides guangzhouensis]|uniref:DNA polymerase ligase N-terminal domain-containing protein n=1 Tax=Nocardioides guangzhouensis TaxID=2497878 RepID=UPI001FEBAEDD|nr:DNA polymerase ligase N-terminal domain-containing protein [Nocardioides guangzhouensis]
MSPVFVVQRHDATNLHYDLRLEVDGALVSWAVPKGPSLDPGVKRLAHRVEDHGMEHGGFEGRIAGSRGAGTVVVWDTGDYDNLTERNGAPLPMAEALAAGHVKVDLHGHRLRGGFALTRTGMGGDEANWLLVKVADEHADRGQDVTAGRNESVLSGRTNADLEE